MRPARVRDVVVASKSMLEDLNLGFISGNFLELRVEIRVGSEENEVGKIYRTGSFLYYKVKSVG